MTIAWKFEHSVEARARRQAAWAFWSDVANWAEIDPALEWARLEGAFRAGARGQTKPVGAPANAWQLIEVSAGRRAVLELCVPGVEVRFTWQFEDGPHGGAVLTQVVEVSEETARQYAAEVQGLAAGIPPGMSALGAAIEHAAGGPPNKSL